MPNPLEIQAKTPDLPAKRIKRRKGRILISEAERVEFPNVTAVDLIRLERLALNAGFDLMPPEDSGALWNAYDNLSAPNPKPGTERNEYIHALEVFSEVLALKLSKSLPKASVGSDVQLLAEWIAQKHANTVVSAGLNYLGEAKDTSPSINNLEARYQKLQDTLTQPKLKQIFPLQ